eukprot:9503226-Pyramimonas_sp.AAC.1
MLMRGGHGVLLAGATGTGKTVTLQHLTRRLAADGGGGFAVAPVGLNFRTDAAALQQVGPRAAVKPLTRRFATEEFEFY